MRSGALVFLRLSVLAVVVFGMSGLLIRPVARALWGVEELLPPMTVRLRADTIFHLGPVPVTNTIPASSSTS